jgi:hypothetical protein
MKNLNLLRMSIIACLACIGLGSCGSKTTPKEEEPKQIVTLSQKTIAGDLSDYFELVQDEYVIISNGFNPELEITVKRTNVELPYDIQYLESFGIVSDDYVKVGLGVECYDKNGIPISIKLPTKCYGEEIISLMKLNSGEFGKFNFILTDGNVVDIKNFKVTSAVEVLNKKLIKTTKNTASNGLDSVLDEFEKAINSLYKDLSNADNLNAVENLQSKLESSKSELTEKQIARLNRLNKRLD